MNSDQGNSGQIKSVVSGMASSIFEKAWDYNWCLKAVYIGLFADLALVMLKREGLAQLALRADVAFDSAGKIICVALAFMIFASLVVPTIVHTLKAVAQSPSLHSYNPSEGSVLLSDLKILALREKSDFLQKLCQSRIQEIEELKSKKNDVMLVLVGIAALIVLNFLAGWVYSVSSLTLWVEVNVGWAALVLPLLAIASSLRWALERDGSAPWVFYPPLYEQQQIKQRAEEAQAAAQMQKYRELQELLRSPHR